MKNPNAFPFQEKQRKNESHTNNVHWRNHSGMSLRDYFAAKAMQAIVNRYGLEENDEILAIKSYEVADVMLKQRDL